MLDSPILRKHSIPSRGMMALSRAHHHLAQARTPSSKLLFPKHRRWRRLFLRRSHTSARNPSSLLQRPRPPTANNHMVRHTMVAP